MAIIGLDKFADFFKGYEDCYTIIGGTACDILLSDRPGGFRATKDIDMIILFEDRFEEFAGLFWRFVKEGEYRCGWKNSDKPHFYRFTEPKSGYPVQIELFSRKSDYHLEADSSIIPIHIDDELSSLSAIMLNDDFYNFMLEGRIQRDGVSILKAAYLVPFKMFAWLNLLEDKAQGRHVNEKDLRKHKNDVFHLLQIIPADESVSVKGDVAETVDRFSTRIVSENIVFSDLGINTTMEQELNAIREIYLR